MYYSVMWVRQFSRVRGRGSIDEAEARQLKIRLRRGRGKVRQINSLVGLDLHHDRPMLAVTSTELAYLR